MRRMVATGVLLVVCGFGLHSQSGGAQVSDATKSLNLAAYAELLRSDVRAEKVAIITEVMGFTEAEDKAFWPIHREYESEMAKLGDERVALVAEYARTYSAMTDEVAHKLGAKALDLEGQRNAVKAKYFERFSTALSPR